MGSEVRYGYADTSLGQVHYREAGSGLPIVLLHESPFSGAVFDAALPTLGNRVRAIAPDTPGYGASPPPSRPPSVAGYAERLTFFLEGLGLERVALVGSHTGGAIAIQLAVDMPKRVRALIVTGALLFSEEEVRDKLENYLVPFNLSDDGAHLAWLWARLRRGCGPDASPELLHFFATEFLQTAARYDWAFRAAYEFDTEHMLPRIACPTLFLITKGDRLRDKNERAVALTHQAEGLVVDNPHGQFSARDPERFAREVLGFLERVGYLTY